MTRRLARAIRGEAVLFLRWARAVRLEDRRKKAGWVLQDKQESGAAGWRLVKGDGPGVLVLSGEIDFSVAPAVRERLMDLAEPGRGELVLDMGDLTYIDSSGLALLLELRKQLQEKGRAVRIRAIAPQVRKLMQLTQIGELFGLPEQG